jgi:hypothetical protein
MVLGFVRCANLTVLRARTVGATNGWALVAAAQAFLASLGARHPIAWSGTWHVALGVRAASRALLFCTRGTWLTALFRASCVTAFDVALLIAKQTWFFAMARSGADVLAIGEITPASLQTFAVVFFDDLCPFPRATIAALILASMTTRLYGSTSCSANVGWVANVDVAG